MEINYRDYVHPSCDESYFSRLSLIDPNSMKKPVMYRFCYSLKFDIEKIKLQSEYFSNEVSRSSYLSAIVNRNISGNPGYKRDILRDLYVYSFMKSYNMCVTLQETGNEFTGNLGANSTVFKGHGELYKLFYDTFILAINGSESEFNSSLYKTISISEDDIKTFKESDFYKRYNESRIRHFFLNSELERLLDAFKKDAKEYMSIIELSEKLIYDPRKSPLGNICLMKSSTSNEDELLIINNRSSMTDLNSKFWNLANNIYFDQCDPIFERCFMTSYIFSSPNELDDACIYAQVQSITGIQCGRQFTTYGYTKPKDDDDDGKRKPVIGKDGSPNPRGKIPDGPKAGSDKQNKKPKADGDNPSKFVKKTTEIIKDGGSAAIKAVKALVSDPDVRSIISKAVMNKLKQEIDDRELVTMTPVTTRRTSTTIGNDYLPIKRVVETENSFVE